MEKNKVWVAVINVECEYSPIILGGRTREAMMLLVAE